MESVRVSGLDNSVCQVTLPYRGSGNALLANLATAERSIMTGDGAALVPWGLCVLIRYLVSLSSEDTVYQTRKRKIHKDQQSQQHRARV